MEIECSVDNLPAVIEKLEELLPERPVGTLVSLKANSEGNIIGLDVNFSHMSSRNTRCYVSKWLKYFPDMETTHKTFIPFEEHVCEDLKPLRDLANLVAELIHTQRSSYLFDHNLSGIFFDNPVCRFSEEDKEYLRLQLSYRGIAPDTLDCVEKYYPILQHLKGLKHLHICAIDDNGWYQPYFYLKEELHFTPYKTPDMMINI